MLTVSPNPVVGLANVTGSVTLQCAAAPGGRSRTFTVLTVIHGGVRALSGVIRLYAIVFLITKTKAPGPSRT